MKIKKIIIGIVVILICIISYKAFMVSYYHVNYTNINTDIVIKNTLAINSKTELTNPLIFDNVKFENTFTDFEKKDAKGDTLALYSYTDANGDNQIFSFTKTNGIVKLIKEKDYKSSVDDKFNKLDRNKILTKYNINNDLDLIKYLAQRKETKSTIISSNDQIKENYFFDYIAINEFPNLGNITLITGNYDGFIINGEDTKMVNIIKNDKKYIFNFMGKSFTDEYVEKFLKSLVIE